MSATFDVLNQLCHKRFNVWWPQYMAHNAVHGIQNLEEFTDLIYTAMEIYSAQNVKDKQDNYELFISELKKAYEEQIKKPILPAEIPDYEQAGEHLSIRHQGWNACLKEIKKLNNWT